MVGSDVALARSDDTTVIAPTLVAAPHMKSRLFSTVVSSFVASLADLPSCACRS
jgi:hypothetical protein